MRLGLVGLPQVGKKTLFHLLTGQEVGPDGARSGAMGLARVRDARFDRLVEMYSPRKVTPAQMEFVLLPDWDRQADRNAEVFQELERADVVCYLARAFEDDTVFHVEGSVDPKRDVGAFFEELQLNDLLFVEKRLERIEKERGRKMDARRAEQEADLLTRMRVHLEDGRPLRQFPLGEEEQKLISSYPFLTRKAAMVVLNVGEDRVGDEALISEMAEAFSLQDFRWIAVSARIEEEIAQLEAGERAGFLAEMGIERPALDRLTLLCYETLGLISFFTVGEDEVRAWTVRKGALAPQAGRAIHADIERGFIRAEVMAYEDLVGLGSEQKVKEAGKLMQKGRDYTVADGDVLNFLFKV